MENKVIYCLLVLVLLSAGVAFGQGTFNAIASGSWNTPGNWSLIGGVDADNIPDADDTATILSGVRISMTGGTSFQIASLNILSGATLEMDNANAVLDIVPDGGLLQVDLGAEISNTAIDDGNEINFLSNGTFVINGIVQTDFLEFEGLDQRVLIIGSGNLLVAGFGVNNSGISIELNTTGSFASNLHDFLVDQPNFTISGTGTIEIGGDQDVRLSSTGFSIGCHMNINVDGPDAGTDASGDLEIHAVGSTLTITNGGIVVTGDDLRVGPDGFDASNANVTVDNGGVLNIGDDINFRNSGILGHADGFVLTNNGTISVNETLEFNSETSITITNNNLFTVDGNITSVAAASSVTFTNAANATFNIGGSIHTEMILDFTATGNTVNYYGGISGVNQTIRTSTIYHHLTLSGSGARSLGGDITLRGNWTRSGAATFTAGTRTVTFSALAGTAAQTISAVGGETFYRLAINSAFATSPQIILSNPVTVTNTLDLISGIVDLNGNQFTLGNSGAASDLNRTASTTTNWMYGGSFRRFWPTGQTPSPTAGNLYGLFPLGHSTASSYRPVQITAGSSISTTGSVTFTHVDASGVTDVTPYDDDPTAGVINIIRKHNSQFTGAVSGVAGGTNYTISVTMTDLAAGTASDIRLAVSNGTSTVTNVGAHVANSGTAQNPIVGRNAMNAVSNLANDFRITTINTTNTPLPIELISFHAKVVQNTVKLDWQTASELNNNYFTLERSTGGELFTSIGQVQGGGTTSQGNKYSLVDYHPVNGTAYYRLKQTDFDGTFTYSKIIDVTYEGSSFAVLDVFPNPSNGGQVTIEIRYLNGWDLVPVVMYDQLGRECVRLFLNVDKNSGTASKTFTPANPLPQGMYLLKAGALTKRFVVNSQ